MRLSKRWGTMAPISIPRPLIIALVVLLACLGLFWLDHETHSFRDLLKPGNLAALVIYFTPTFLLCFGMYGLLRKWHGTSGSLTIALISGIPIGFILVILLLLQTR